MAKWKKAQGTGDQVVVNAKLRRHYKEKARREKLLRQKPPALKDRFVQLGCALLVTGTVLTIVIVLWTVIRHRWFE